MAKINEIKSKAAKMEARYGKTLGATMGYKPPPKPKISLKGTNPLKDKYAITVTKKF